MAFRRIATEERERSAAVRVFGAEFNDVERVMTTENADRIWKAAEGIRTAMLVTWTGEALISRPMAAIVRADEGAIWFLTDKDSGKLDDIAAYPEVSVSFSDGSTQVAFHGAASVHDDRAKIKDLWSNAAQACYPGGPTDPLVVALRVDPARAELWDGPGAVIAMIKMAAAVAQGKSVRDIGEHVEAAV
jgi:general stress protein 26